MMIFYMTSLVIVCLTFYVESCQSNRWQV